MDNKTSAAPVDIAPTAQEIAQLIGEMLAPPRVYAYEVAEELGCHESGISRYLNGRAKSLPHENGPVAFRAAVRRIRARKGAAA